MSDEVQPEAGGLLTDEVGEINLLAEQGEFDEALGMCRRLLQQHPTASELHEAMGDVHRRRGAWQEAAACYEAALQLYYDADVFSKLAEMRGRIAELRRRAAEEYQGETELETDAARKRTIFMLIGAGALALIAIIVVVASVSGRSKAGPGGTQARRPAATGGQYGPPVAGRPSTPAEGSSGLPGSAPGGAVYPGHNGSRQAGQAAAAAVRTGVQAPPPVSGGAPARAIQAARGPESDRDFFLARAIESLTWPDGETLDGHVNVMFDPYTAYAMITIETPQAMPRRDLYQVILRQSFAVANAALKAEKGLQQMTVRCLTRVETGEATHVETAYRGNTTRTTLDFWERARTTPSLDDLWYRVFATSWWNSSVPAQ